MSVRKTISIHALLAESDTWARGSRVTYVEISIHALLAESDLGNVVAGLRISRFLSTLSLRRATACRNGQRLGIYHFYPRSPCGERQRPLESRSNIFISIHALLAESDDNLTQGVFNLFAFLSTLSLRRATGPIIIRVCYYTYFYPRSPCGERREGCLTS